MGVKQQTPSSTNAPKTMQFAKLKGVDYSTSPFEVNPSRAVDMRNIINDYGINHKRPGWTENTEFLKKLGGYGEKIIGLYQIDDSRYIVGYSDRVAIFSKDGEYLHGKAADTTILSIDFHRLDKNRILILSDLGAFKGIDILSLTRDGYEYLKFDYTPTTTISINADSVASTRKSFEEASLTTDKRKNKIISNDKAIRVRVEYAGTDDYQLLQKVTFTNKKGQSVVWEDLDAFATYTNVTAVLLEDNYDISVTLKKGSVDSVIFIKKKDENGKDTEETITSIDLTEDITIYAKEA